MHCILCLQALQYSSNLKTTCKVQQQHKTNGRHNTSPPHGSAIPRKAGYHSSILHCSNSSHAVSSTVNSSAFCISIIKSNCSHNHAGLAVAYISTWDDNITNAHTIATATMPTLTAARISIRAVSCCQQHMLQQQALMTMQQQQQLLLHYRQLLQYHMCHCNSMRKVAAHALAQAIAMNCRGSSNNGGHMINSRGISVNSSNYTGR